MTKIERVKKLCKWLIYIGYADNDAELAAKIGYTKSSFSQIINEKVPLSDKFIDKICATNENINKVWIYTGKGDLQKSKIEDSMNLNEPTAGYNNTITDIDHLEEKLKFQAEQISWYKQQLDYLTDQLTAKKNLDKNKIEEVLKKLDEIERAEINKSIQ